MGGRGAGGAAVVGVLGASGGVGTSCVAAALATVAARTGLRTVCADASAHGGGIDALFDLESRPGARWPDLAAARGRLDGAALLRHLPVSADGVHVLAAADQPADQPPGQPLGSEGADPGPVLTALAAAADALVLDLGTAGGAGPIGAVGPAAAGSGPPSGSGPPCCDDLILVVGAGVPALARAGRAAAIVAAGGAGRAWLVQRVPRGRADLADLVAERLGLPLLGVVPDDPRLDDALARGVPPGAARTRLGALADRFWGVLAAQERIA